MSAHRPEILAPAGCLRRLQTAVVFGADAVYVGATHFGLRKHADNLNDAELRSGIAFAHARGAKVYVACNIMPLQRDWDRWRTHLARLAELGPDALIVADPGIAASIRSETGLRIHVSTQASVTNRLSALSWRERGASRIVLARELTLEQAAAIRAAVDIEVECFVHGSMCTSYSGKCVISNYTAGRDANRGGCVQTCRHQFTVHPGRSAGPTPDYSAPIMNSRDLMALASMPRLIAAGIDACKIEGRMKSALYVAATVSAYRQAAEGVTPQAIAAGPVLEQLSNRTFTTGSLHGRAYADSLNFAFEGYQGTLTNLGQCLAWEDRRGALLHLRTSLAVGDEVHWLLPGARRLSATVRQLHDTSGRSWPAMRTDRCVWLMPPEPVPAYSVAWLARPGDHVCKNAVTRHAASA